MGIPTYQLLKLSQWSKGIDSAVKRRLQRMNDMKATFGYQITAAELLEIDDLGGKLAQVLIGALAVAPDPAASWAWLQAKMDAIDKRLADGDVILDRLEKTLSQRAMQKP